MTTQVTPENLTFENIKSWDGPEMRRQMAHPEMRDAISRIAREKTLAEVEAAQLAIDARVVDSPVEKTAEELAAEEQRVQAEQAEVEAQRLVAEQEAARVVEPKKFVIDYQVKDEDGNPIGRPTHLEAPTEEELRGKIIEAHIQATRAFHRLKKQKVSFKEPPPAAPVQASDAELLAAMKDLRSDDPQKQLDAVRKVQKVETDKIQAEADRKLAEANELHRQQQVSRSFLDRHKQDFNNCEANVNIIKEYFMENELAWTLDNLEIAFHAKESELAPVESVAPIVPANPVVVAPVIPATPPAVQPVVVATAPVITPVNPVVITPRPGVNGGLIPGQNSGSRPVITTTTKLTAEEIRSWSGPTMRANMRNPAMRAQIDAFFLAHNQGKK